MNHLHIFHVALCSTVVSIHNNLVTDVLAINETHTLRNLCSWCGFRGGSYEINNGFNGEECLCSANSGEYVT